jgi:hypothetical protein
MRGGRRRRRFGYNRSGNMLLGFLRELGRRREREDYVRRVAFFILILCVFVLPSFLHLCSDLRVCIAITLDSRISSRFYARLYICVCICVFLHLRIARLLPVGFFGSPSSSSACTELHFHHLFSFPFRSPRSHSRFRQPDGCLNACG